MTSGSHDSGSGPQDGDAQTTHATGPRTLVAAAVSDRCVSCGAPLSSDQRYCVVCGERRGAPRFSLPSTTAPDAQSPAPVAPAPAARGGRFSSGTTLVAGVATLLLAMLVGVLIGHDTASQGSRTIASAPVRIITTGGGSTDSTSDAGSAPAAPTKVTKSSKTPATSSKKPSGAKLKAKKSAPKAPKKTVAAESGAAKKVLGGSGTPPATVTVGATGTGKGYSKKTHKFTGSFFGN